jgi:hypothetical protein
MDGWSLGKSTDQLIQKILGTDLEMEWIAAVLDADVEELQAISTEHCKERS